MLKICDDDIIFTFVHTSFFDFCCFFVLVFLIGLCFLIKNDNILEKIKNKIFIKIIIITFSLVFVSFLIFIFIWLIYSSSVKNCACKYYESASNIFYKSIENETNYLKNNRVLIIGDSRMELMEEDKNLIKPENFDFIAKSAMKYTWFHDEALPKAYKTLKNNKYDKYNIVVNMGVNDLNDDIDIKKRADEYFDEYEKLAQYNSKINLYILSINPIFEKRLNETQKYNTRTNKKIEEFNKEIIKKINNSKEGNIYYCNAYDKLKFKSDDGIHYIKETNEKIIDYIINDCIKY